MADSGPWLWWFEAGFSGFTALIARPAIAVAWAVLTSFAPVISSYAFAGIPEEALLGGAIIHLSNVVFVVLVITTRHRLLALAEAEHEALAARIESHRAAAQRKRMEALARTVHDEVLSALVAAMRTEGAAPDSLRAQAKSAMAALTEHSGRSRTPSTMRLPDETALALLADAVTAASPNIRLAQSRGGGAFPAEAIRTVALAAGEAARNAVRHAGPGASIDCAIRLDDGGVVVEVRDDGPGFMLDEIPADRMGVRRSILQRMEALPGGSALIRRESSHTVVELAWRG